MIIGAGQYGTVYYGLTKNNFNEIAIKKIDKKKVEERIVDIEAGTIQRLNDTNLFQKIYDFIKDKHDFFYLIESLLGPDLSKFISFSGKIDKKTAYKLGIELIFVT